MGLWLSHNAPHQPPDKPLRSSHLGGLFLDDLAKTSRHSALFRNKEANYIPRFHPKYLRKRRNAVFSFLWIYKKRRTKGNERLEIEAPCSKLQGMFCLTAVLRATVRNLVVFWFARYPRSKLRGMCSLLQFNAWFGIEAHALPFQLGVPKQALLLNNLILRSFLIYGYTIYGNLF